MECLIVQGCVPNVAGDSADFLVAVCTATLGYSVLCSLVNTGALFKPFCTALNILKCVFLAHADQWACPTVCLIHRVVQSQSVFLIAFKESTRDFSL